MTLAVLAIRKCTFAWGLEVKTTQIITEESFAFHLLHRMDSVPPIIWTSNLALLATTVKYSHSSNYKQQLLRLPALSSMSYKNSPITSIQPLRLIRRITKDQFFSKTRPSNRLQRCQHTITLLWSVLLKTCRLIRRNKRRKECCQGGLIRQPHSPLTS